MSNNFDEFENEVEIQPTFEDALEELKTDDETMPGPAIIVGLSGLTDDQLQQLIPVWNNLSTSYRRILIQMLVDALISNFALDFTPIGYMALNANEPAIRQSAIELLWEDESSTLLRKLLEIATQDESLAVRAEATKALGRFVLLGEMDGISEALVSTTQETLLGIINNTAEDLDIRRFAIESIANCTRNEVTGIIKEAYKSTDSTMRLSAVVAMGRSCDERWENEVLEELENSDDDIRIAATRAAGELQLGTATGQIIKNIESGDREEQEIAIQSLGEIGGREVMRTLESLLAGAEDAEDVELMDLIDEAIGNASLINGDLMMIDFSGIND